MKIIIYTIAACLLISTSYAQQKPNNKKPKTSTVTKKPTNPTLTQSSVPVTKTDSGMVMPANMPQVPQISFYEEVRIIPSVQRGIDYICEFKFQNSGNSPLIILNVSGAKAEFPKDSIPAGASGSIMVQFSVAADAAAGDVNKEITVHSNALNQSAKVLLIKGTVAN